jgi:hypothetical protein
MQRNATDEGHGRGVHAKHHEHDVVHAELAWKFRQHACMHAAAGNHTTKGPEMAKTCKCNPWEAHAKTGLKTRARGKKFLTFAGLGKYSSFPGS